MKKEFCGCFRISLLSQSVCLSSVCMFVLSVSPSYYKLDRCHPKTCMLRLDPKEKVKSLGDFNSLQFLFGSPSPCGKQLVLPCASYFALHTPKSNETKGPRTKALKSVNKHWHLRLFRYSDDGPRTHRHPPPGSAPQMLRLKASSITPISVIH